MTFQHLKRFER